MAKVRRKAPDVPGEAKNVDFLGQARDMAPATEEKVGEAFQGFAATLSSVAAGLVTWSREALLPALLALGSFLALRDKTSEDVKKKFNNDALASLLADHNLVSTRKGTSVVPWVSTARWLAGGGADHEVMALSDGISVGGRKYPTIKAAIDAGESITPVYHAARAAIGAFLADQENAEHRPSGWKAPVVREAQPSIAAAVAQAAADGSLRVKVAAPTAAKPDATKMVSLVGTPDTAVTAAVALLDAHRGRFTQSQIEMVIGAMGAPVVIAAQA